MNRYCRTRRDHATETAEDYVEAVDTITEQTGRCRVTDLAREFGVSHVTVTRIVSRLADEGWVRTEPYRPIELTRKGKQLAAKAKERHKIVLDFLVALGVPREVAAVDAEGIEHHVSPPTLARFREWTRELNGK